MGLNTILSSIKHLLYTKILAWLKQTSLQIEIDAQMSILKEQARIKDPRSLLSFGYKVYSQTDEDGMIAEIFNRIGTTNRFFVEIGVGNGLENNSSIVSKLERSLD